MSEMCRSCLAPIRWVQTERTKPMPLDPEPTPAGNVLLEERGGGPVAVVLNSEDADEAYGHVNLYTAHHATCPQADDWRRK